MAEKIEKKMNGTFEKNLFKAADKLRKNMDAAEYKHIVLGLIFLKYISDSFEDLHTKLTVGKGEYEGSDPEDADEYRGENVFWVPKKARWSYLHSRAKLPAIGKDVDDAMEAIENENATLKGILPKVYARPNLDKVSLGGLIDLIGNIALGDEAAKSKDILGRVYEYFLGEFALAEGKKGGQFYTPKSIVQLLVDMIEPFRGRVYDPCCGSGGMFVMSERFVEQHRGRLDDIAIYGQESNQTTYRLCRMNLALRGIDGSQVKWNNEGSFLKDAQPDLKADFILANPPFNDSDWSGELLRKDGRWKMGVPPASNANFAWMQHIVYHLSPSGTAGIVLADSSLTTTSADEADIRKRLVEEGYVDCIVSLPSHLFSNTQITACLWFLARNKRNGRFRNREQDVLFIDASRMGVLDTRKHRILTVADIDNITSIYHSWRNPDGKYNDIRGVCRSVKYGEIRDNDFNLAPSRYVKTKTHEVNVDFDLGNKLIWDSFKELKDELQNNLEELSTKRNKGVRLHTVWQILRCSKKMSIFASSLYASMINEYFIVHQHENSKGKIPSGWERKQFGDIFEERKYSVQEHGSCPPIYSVTNSGIQQREGKFSKELSKSSEGYRIAFQGDMVFGLSREIPNLDVFVDEIGAFSPAYYIFKPSDPRIGLIVGHMMRLKLMEQTDILKGGAREGRGLDKDKLMRKEFILPSTKSELNRYFDEINVVDGVE